MAYTTINKSTEHFDTKLYTGTGSAMNITGVGFKPDLTWVKPRSATDNHILYDSVRGVTKILRPNLNLVEGTVSTMVTAFNSDGVSLGTNGNVTANGVTFAAWNWKGGGASSANTDGATSSTVSVNTTSGFSIVKWSGYNTTVGHGLGVAPDMILVKNLDDTQNWHVYNKQLGINKYAILNTNGGSTTSTSVWSNTLPTSTVFSIGGSPFNNANYIAYCFSNTTGFSKHGTYIGSASASTGFVYTGFKPKFLMTVNTQSDSNWMMWDDARNTFNPVDKWLHANGTDQEYTQTNSVNFLSNGFSFGVTGHPNEAQQYTYMCFGQSMVGTNGVTAKAR
jgi:hypothetical protein